VAFTYKIESRKVPLELMDTRLEINLQQSFTSLIHNQSKIKIIGAPYI